MLSSFKTTYSTLAPMRKLGLFLAMGVLLLLTAAAIWWALAPRQALLFGELKQADAAEVSAALDEWKIPHSYTADGSGILVEQGQVHPCGCVWCLPAFRKGARWIRVVRYQ